MVVLLEEVESANTTLDRGSKIKASDLHELLGHVGDNTAHLTAKNYGWIVTGSTETCEDCLISKSKHKKISKTTHPRNKKKGELLMLDISSVKSVSFGNRKFWLGVLDFKTDYLWSYYLKSKDELYDNVLHLIDDLKMKNNINVKTIHCDNTGENNKFQEICMKRGLGITFEFTPAGNPQFNGRIERKFATLYGRVRYMLNKARLTQDLCSKCWAECA